MMLRQAATGAAPATELERLVAASGKMVLLNKLLPKLRAEGHKVRARMQPSTPAQCAGTFAIAVH